MFGTRKALKYYSKTTSFGLWYLSAFGAKYPKRCPDRLTCCCCLWGFLRKNWSFLEQFPKHRAIHYFATIFDWLNQMTSGFLCCLKWRFLYCNKCMVPNGFWRQLDGTLGFTKYLACFTKDYFQIFPKSDLKASELAFGVSHVFVAIEKLPFETAEKTRGHLVHSIKNGCKIMYSTPMDTKSWFWAKRLTDAPVRDVRSVSYPIIYCRWLQAMVRAHSFEAQD